MTVGLATIEVVGDITEQQVDAIVKVVRLVCFDDDARAAVEAAVG